MKKLLAIILALCLMTSLGTMAAVAYTGNTYHCTCCGSVVGGGDGNYHGSQDCCNYYPMCEDDCDPWPEPHPDPGESINPDNAAPGTASWWNRLFAFILGLVPQGTINTVSDVVGTIVDVLGTVIGIFI